MCLRAETVHCFPDTLPKVIEIKAELSDSKCQHATQIAQLSAHTFRQYWAPYEWAENIHILKKAGE